MFAPWTQLRLDGRGYLKDQLHRALEALILDPSSGGVQPQLAGTALPATRQLAEHLGISRTVVLGVYERLTAEGLVAAKRGSGHYLSQAPTSPSKTQQTQARETPPLALLSRAARSLAEWQPKPEIGPLPFDFRSGRTPQDPRTRELWHRAIRRNVDRNRTRYGDPQGDAELREALCMLLARHRGVPARPEQLVLVSGSQQALDLIGRTLIDPGDRVLVEKPCYAGIRWVVGAYGAKLREVPVDDQGLITERLPRRGRLPKLAFVTPASQVPTTAELSPARRLALAHWARQFGVLLIEDDYDGMVSHEGPGEPALASLTEAPPMIHIGTFSLTLFPGLRLGYAVLPENFVEPFSKSRWLADRHNPELEQRALLDLLKSGEFERHLRRMGLRVKQARDSAVAAIETAFAEHACIVSRDRGRRLILRLKQLPAEREPEFVRAAAQRGIGISTLVNYGGQSSHGYSGLSFDFSCATPEQINRGVRSLAELYFATTDM